MKRNILSLMTLGAAGCVSSTTPTPAVLTNASPQTMDKVRAVLTEATGRARITLGPGDPTQTSTLSVLPSGPTSLEGNSPVLPEIFYVVRTPDGCALQRKRDGVLFAIHDVGCRRL